MTDPKRRRRKKKIHRRNCVICSNAISTEDPEIWVCSKECERELEERKALKVMEEAEIREINDLRAMPISEAQKARQGISLLLGGAPEEQEPTPSIPEMVGMPGGDWLEQLEAALGLIKTARKLSDPADAYLMVEIARGFLERASETLHGSVDMQDEDENTEVAEA